MIKSLICYFNLVDFDNDISTVLSYIYVFRLILLANGSCAYHGSTKNALQYFSNRGFHCPDHYNAADFYCSTLTIKPLNEKKSETIIQVGSYASVTRT